MDFDAKRQAECSQPNTGAPVTYRGNDVVFTEGCGMHQLYTCCVNTSRANDHA